MGNDEFIDIYRRYLAKFEKLFGELDFDETVQHRGKLVKKMRYDEFVTKWTEFKQIEDYLREVMSKGATLNDEVNRNYLELSASVLENPKDFVLI
jgi:hypothetical protein